MNNTIIPIFFACDDNYAPFLMVTIKSIIENSNNHDIYKIYVLNTGIATDHIELIKKYEKENLKINFVDVTSKIQEISKELDDVRDYYTKAIFYRLFIASLFPQYDKAIYLDCDIVVLNDIANFFKIELDNNILGVVVDDVVANNDDFKVYTKETVGVEANKYFNSGVLLMNLEQYRKHNIENIFVEITKQYNFPSVAPDQDFLNFMCYGKVKYLSKSWNRMPIEDGYDGELNLIHYNMFMKPWRYNIMYEEYFWKYAEMTEFFELLKDMKNNYSDDNRQSDLKGVERMVKQAYQIIDSKYNLNSKLNRDELYGKRS